MEICQGDSIHECKQCGEPFFCYACPDEMNSAYTETICHSCLHEWLYGAYEAMKGGKP